MTATIEGESMEHDSPDGGGGLVRVDALTAKYLRANNEADLESVLAAELRAQGWSVLPQVWCRPMNESNRRIDLYVSGSVAVQGRDHDKADITIGIEIKQENSMRQSREAYSQIRRYRESFLWSDWSGRLLAPPMWFCFTNRDLLGMVGRRPDRFLFDRMLWDVGGSMLMRRQDGNLVASIRYPLLKRFDDGRAIFTNTDMTVQLTNWRTA